MKNPFTTYPHYTSPSINRVYLAVLPSGIQDKRLLHKTAYELLSTQALVQQIRAQAHHLQLPAHALDLLPAFDTCFSHPTPSVRTAAHKIAVTYGRALAAVLLALKQGHPANRAARPDWSDGHWGYWQTLNNIWIGGGLLAGQLGDMALAETRRLIYEAGYPDYQVRRSLDAPYVVLRGAAQALPLEVETALLFDFGHTLVKRAVTFYRGDGQRQWHYFSELPAACGDLAKPGPNDRQAQAQAAHILTILTNTWQKAIGAGWQPGHHVVVSVACYLVGGHPTKQDWGCYGRMQQLAPNLEAFLAQKLAQALGQSVRLHLLHDGQAAAMVYQGERNCAILTLGTAVGVGFPGVISGE